jgi:hypothetical protein
MLVTNSDLLIQNWFGQSFFFKWTLIQLNCYGKVFFKIFIFLKIHLTSMYKIDIKSLKNNNLKQKIK